MRLFPVVIVLVGIFVYLMFHYSFLLAFGICYAAGLVFVAVLTLVAEQRPENRAWPQGEKVEIAD